GLFPHPYTAAACTWYRLSGMVDTSQPDEGYSSASVLGRKKYRPIGLQILKCLRWKSVKAAAPGQMELLHQIRSSSNLLQMFRYPFRALGGQNRYCPNTPMLYSNRWD